MLTNHPEAKRMRSPHYSTSARKPRAFKPGTNGLLHTLNRYARLLIVAVSFWMLPGLTGYEPSCCYNPTVSVGAPPSRKADLAGVGTVAQIAPPPPVARISRIHVGELSRVRKLGDRRIGILGQLQGLLWEPDSSGGIGRSLALDRLRRNGSTGYKTDYMLVRLPWTMSDITAMANLNASRRWRNTVASNLPSISALREDQACTALDIRQLHRQLGELALYG
jgi:hypothetical protein